jgi:hypothetical protein
MFRSPETVNRLPLAKTLGLAWLAGALATLCAAPASAVIFYTGGIGGTVYGVAPYGGGGVASPSFLNNVNTGFSDILASPGHNFQTANPVVANNIAQTGIAGLPLFSFQIGGGNGFGSFGRAETLISGPQVGFAMRDAGHPGLGSLSYSISSWTSNFAVGAGGFTGNLGTYLSVGGRLPTSVSADAVSLVSNYYINNVLVGETTPLILAAAGNGNFQALGGSFEGLVFGGGGTWSGLAIDNLPVNLPAGDTVKVVSTLTEFADPASIDSIVPDLSLFPDAVLPDFSIADVGGGVPEPAAWALMLVGLSALGGALRGQRRRSAARAGA